MHIYIIYIIYTKYIYIYIYITYISNIYQIYIYIHHIYICIYDEYIYIHLYMYVNNRILVRDLFWEFPKYLYCLLLTTRMRHEQSAETLFSVCLSQKLWRSCTCYIYTCIHVQFHVVPICTPHVRHLLTLSGTKDGNSLNVII